MHALSPHKRNVLATVGIGILFITLSLVGPNGSKMEAEFRCAPDFMLEAVYVDMLICSKAMDASTGRGCSCSRPDNPWASWYFDYFVPPAIGVVAWIFLIGSLGMRIGLLNAGFWGAILLLGIYYAFTNPEGIEGLVLSFGHLVYVALMASVVLGALHFVVCGVALMRSP
jgi:hypothetical protein